MSLLTAEGSAPPLGIVYYDMLKDAAGLKQTAINVSAAMASGDYAGSSAVGFAERCVKLSEKIDKAKALGSAMHQFAKDQHDTVTYDVLVEVNTLQVAALAVADQIFAIYPKSASGYLESAQVVDRKRVLRMFTPGQTASIRPLIDTLAAAID